MGEQMTRQTTVIENLTVATTHTSSKKIPFEEFLCGAVFIPANTVDTINWWGGAQDTPAGASSVLAGQTGTYPTNSVSGSAINYAPIMNAAGAQVSQNVNGGALGRWYPIPVECQGLASLKITSSGNVTSVAVCLKS